jgi:hypothetical protein
VNIHLRRFWRHYRSAHGAEREILTLALCLATGIFLMPALIWLVGRAALGAYAHGGMLALWRDYLHGLATGSSAFWIIALGPYAFVWVLRGGRRLFMSPPG